MNEEQNNPNIPAPVLSVDKALNIGPFKRWQVIAALYIIISAILELQRLPADHTHEGEAFTYVIMQLIIICIILALIIFSGIILIVNKHKIWVRVMSDILSFILICIAFTITIFNFLVIFALFFTGNKIN